MYDLKKGLENFLGKKTKKTKDGRVKVMEEREGLVERLDKILVTKDGKQLLREQY